MKEITLDCTELRDREALHKALEQALALPSWYGRNLDALYDCLTELPEPVHLTLTGLAALENYGKRLSRVIRDAAAENPKLQFRLEE